MYKTVALMLFFTSILYAQKSDYVRLSYDFLEFKNSKQKESGKRLTLHLQKRVEQNIFSLAYEKTDTQTFQPPLPDDLRVDKLYLQYARKIAGGHTIQTGYIYIDDNLAPTDGTKIFSLAYKHRFENRMKVGGAFYLGDFSVVDTRQYRLFSDIPLSFEDLHCHFIAEVDTIELANCTSGFCSNAKENYIFGIFKAKFDYKKYFLHMGATAGKRAFSVMRDGFACSHHAMEFNKTYMLGFGKHFGDFLLKLRYAYLEATELPFNNSGVRVDDVMLRVQYFF